MKMSFDPVETGPRGLRLRRCFPSVAGSCAILICVVVFATVGFAQSADKIFKQATKAHGGEKALKRNTSWDARGSITRVSDGLSGSFRQAATQPNLYAVKYDLDGLESSVVYNGKSAWLQDSRNGLSTLTGVASRNFQVQAAFRNFRWLNFKNARSKAATAGQTTIDGAPVNIVTLTTVKNVVVRMFFDARTGLLIRDELPGDTAPIITTYSDYRPVDGVMEAFRAHISESDGEFDIRFSEIRHNSPVDPALFDFPRVSNAPLPDIPALLQQLTANETHIEELLENYGYTETTSDREFDDHGVLQEKESETHELIFFKGNRIRRLTAKNGQPLSASDQAKEDKRVEKEIGDLEKKVAEKERKASKEGADADSSDESRKITISDILRASRLVNPRREVFRGRDVIVFDFEPMPGYKPQKDYEKLFGKMAGVMWIDDADRQVARLEAQLVDSYKIGGGLVASLKKGGSFVFEQQRVNNEIWLPTSVEVNFSAKVLLFKSITANQLTTFGNYQRFNTEVQKATVNDPDTTTPKP